MSGINEQAAVMQGCLPFSCWSTVAPFFPTLRREQVRIVVQSRTVATYTYWIGMPAVTVYGDTNVCVPGVLDVSGFVRRNFWSWTDPRGIALWGHEIKHVEQWLANPAAFVWQAAWGITRSLLRGKVYDHSVIEYEREAIAFQRHVLETLMHRG